MYRKYVRKSTGKSATPVKKPTYKYATRNSPGSTLSMISGMKFIGKGAYGKIYMGYSPKGTRYAIKKSNMNVSRECALQKRAHAVVPNHVVQVYSCSPNEMVSEYFRGGTLKAFIVKHKDTLSDDDMRNFILQVTCTLKILHSKLPSFRHHDTHLENILVDDSQTAGIELIDSFAIPSNGIRLALTDFGLSTNTNSVANNTFKSNYGIAKNSDVSYDVHFFLAALNDFIGKVKNAPLTKLFLAKILKGYAKETNTHTRKFRLIYGHRFMTYAQILGDAYFNKYRAKKAAKNVYINFGKPVVSPKKKVTVMTRTSPRAKWTRKNINLRDTLKYTFKDKGRKSLSAYLSATKLVDRVAAKKPLLKRLIGKKVAAIRARKAAAAGPSRARTLDIKTFLTSRNVSTLRPKNIEEYLRTGYSTPVAKQATKAIVNKLVANRSGVSSPGVTQAWKQVQNVLGTSFGNVNIISPGGTPVGGRDVRVVTESKVPAGYFIVDAREKSSSSTYRALNPYYPIGFTYKGYHAKSLMGLWNAIKYIDGKGTNKTRMGMNTGVRRVGKVAHYLFNGKKLTEKEALAEVFVPAYKMLLETKLKNVVSEIRKHPKIAILCENKTAASTLKGYLSG